MRLFAIDVLRFYFLWCEIQILLHVRRTVSKWVQGFLVKRVGLSSSTIGDRRILILNLLVSHLWRHLRGVSYHVDPFPYLILWGLVWVNDKLILNLLYVLIAVHCLIEAIRFLRCAVLRRVKRGLMLIIWAHIYENTITLLQENVFWEFVSSVYGAH